MRRITALAVGAAVVLAGATAAVASPASAPRDSSATSASSYAWSGEPTGIFRTSTYDQGEWIYTNGIWQALGANSDQLHRTDYYRAFYPAPGDPTFITRDLYNALTYDFFGSHRAAHNGDYQLPLDSKTWPDGTGDLAELRMTRVGDQVLFRFLWNSMPRPDAQIATLTFRTSGVPAPVAVWPAGANLKGTWQKALTLWGTGGEWSTTGSTTIMQGTLPGTSTSVTPVTTTDLSRIGGSSGYDLRSHTTWASVPIADMPSGQWTLQGGSGLTDPTTRHGYWSVPAGGASQTAPGSGGPTSPTNVWDLLFAQDTPWTFDERSQADQLANGLDTATAAVNPTMLGAAGPGITQWHSGDLSRMFASRYAKADGIVKDSQGISPIAPPAGFSPPIANPGFNVNYFYTGRLQTYAMHVPSSYDGRSARPLIVYLHGFTGLPEEPFHNPVGLVDEADKRGYLFASALGRGDYFYKGEGDLDVTEVIADVEKHYNVDRSRIYLMGHSMGGYGTNNVAAHHPDLFAAVAPAEGTDSVDLSANLRNVPWLMLTADEDLDTMAKNALAHYTTLSNLGYDATVVEYRTKIHEYSSIYDTLPRLFAFFGSHTRPASPAIVSYVKRPGDERPDLGLRYDSAYWVSGLQASAASQVASIRVESMLLPHAADMPSRATRTDVQTDEQGPTHRSIAQVKQTVPSRFPAPTSRTLTVAASNLRSAALDLRTAGVDLRGGSVTIPVSTSATLRLQLDVGSLTVRNGYAAVNALLDGQRVATQPGGGVVTVTVPTGSHTVSLAELIAVPDPPPPSPSPTPGGGHGKGGGKGHKPHSMTSTVAWSSPTASQVALALGLLAVMAAAFVVRRRTAR